MLGPFYRYETPIFTEEIDGNPTQVDILLRAPSGTETQIATSYNSTTGKWETLPTALTESGKNWWKRANVWLTGYATPITCNAEMFEVYADGFTLPIEQP